MLRFEIEEQRETTKIVVVGARLVSEEKRPVCCFVGLLGVVDEGSVVVVVGVMIVVQVAESLTLVETE